MPTKTELFLRSFDKIARRPFLQATEIPEAPVHRDYYNGILMNGAFAYKACVMAYYTAPVPLRSLPTQAKPQTFSTDVYVGKSPSRGIYTGVKNGRQ